MIYVHTMHALLNALLLIDITITPLTVVTDYVRSSMALVNV